MGEAMAGILYLCATPIGNMEDITLRTLRILQESALIAAEDTRNTRKLLTRYEIQTPMTSYHEHNKHAKGPVLLEKLSAGQDIALVSDAGMPGISDPGADLVRACQEAGIQVTTAPGASACLVAVVLSGLDNRRFVFEGFLPTEKKERKAVLEALEKEHRTMVFYEAPHRLVETLQALEVRFGAEREMAATRELTKKFEEIKRGTIGSLLEYYTQQPPKGEFVLVVAGHSLQAQKKEAEASWEEVSVAAHVMQHVAAGMSEKDAMKQAAKERGVSKRDIYDAFKGKHMDG